MVRQGDRQRTAAAARPDKDQTPLLAVGRPRFTRDLKDLENTETEVKTIGRLFGDRGELLLGDRASRKEVQARIGKARRLHFATHGLVNEARPMFSSLALTPAAADDDGRLYAHDVMNLNLSAELVVLSACETALGREYRGEGTVGLSWAFFVAGAPSVVVTQWSVADATTSTLMQRFYRNLTAAKPPSKGEALRQAQLSLLKDRKTRHPFYWAPFILIGDWDK
jgi:CHAT domain-containing protein